MSSSGGGLVGASNSISNINVIAAQTKLLSKIRAIFWRVYFDLTVNDEQSERCRLQDGRFAGVVTLVGLPGVPDDQMALGNRPSLSHNSDPSPVNTRRGLNQQIYVRIFSSRSFLLSQFYFTKKTKKTKPSDNWQTLQYHSIIKLSYSRRWFNKILV